LIAHAMYHSCVLTEGCATALVRRQVRNLQEMVLS
jgi:hypothetical protein